MAYSWNIGVFQADSPGTDYAWNIGTDQTDAETGTFVDAEATISGTGTLTATGLTSVTIDAEVTITGTSSITAYAVANIRTSKVRTILVAIGNSQLYYEDS